MKEKAKEDRLPFSLLYRCAPSNIATRDTREESFLLGAIITETMRTDLVDNFAGSVVHFEAALSQNFATHYHPRTGSRISRTAEFRERLGSRASLITRLNFAGRSLPARATENRNYKAGKFQRKCAKDSSKSNSFAMVDTTPQGRIVREQNCITTAIIVWKNDI